jgi:hypothetical protein
MRILTVVALTAALLSGAVSAVAQPAGPAAAPTAGHLVNFRSYRCAEPTGATPTWGFGIAQETCQNNAQHQLWTFQYTEGDYVRVVTIENSLCLDVDNGRTDSGAGVIQWGCRDTDNDSQEWLRTDGGGIPGAFKLVNRKSGKCMDAYLGSIDRVSLIQFDCRNHNDASQKWTARP